LQSRLNTLNLPRQAQSPWLVSGLAHAALAGAIALLLMEHSHSPESVDITVIDVRAQNPKAVTLSRPEPKKVEKKQPRAVFGLSRKSITSDQTGEEVKLGNTVAKTPDQEKLKPEDADQLPVPTEEYLVTRMPELAQEVRVPYPAEARRKGLQGAVVMDLLIDESGKVREAKLVQGPEESLNQAALSAVHGFLFRPALIQDKPVAVRIRYAYRFVLER
jgi:TonB family protein